MGEAWVPQGAGGGQLGPQRNCWTDPRADEAGHWGSPVSPNSAIGVSDK